MRKILVFAIPIAVLALSIFGVMMLFANKPEPEKAEGPTSRKVSLFVEEVRREPVTLAVTTQGEVQPVTEIDLVPQVSGRIVAVAPEFVEGGIVAPGQTLVQIERDDYEFAVTRAKAQVAQAKLRLAQEEAGAEIARKQWDWDEIKDKGKPGALALKEPQVADAAAQLAAAQAELNQAELNLARTKISVPFKGRVREKSADIGQYVTAGTRLGQAFSTERVRVRLPLTDQQMAQIDLPIAFDAGSAGGGLAVTLRAQLAGRMRHWEGRIVRTDAAIDQQTRLFYAIAEVRDPYGQAASGGMPLPVGLFVTAAIEGRALESAHVLPRAALRGENIVYVVTEDDTLAIRRIEVISANAERVIAGAGVEAGDRVVVSPVRAPREGMPVEPLSQAQAARLASAGSR